MLVVGSLSASKRYEPPARTHEYPPGREGVPYQANKPEEALQVPEVKPPEVKLPEIQLPEVQLPEVQLPKVQPE